MSLCRHKAHGKSVRVPCSWSAHDARMYESIKRQCRKSRRGLKTCKRIAAATVNKYRSR